MMESSVCTRIKGGDVLTLASVWPDSSSSPFPRQRADESADRLAALSRRPQQAPDRTRAHTHTSPTQNVRLGSALTTASGFQCVTGGTGSMGAPSLRRSQLTISTPGKQTGSGMKDQKKSASQQLTHTGDRKCVCVCFTWQVFADDVSRLRSSGHTGVDQNIVLQTQRCQTLTCQLSLVPT